MNTVITIGREFGSGGREIGKRLAELLGIAYYDKEIVAEISNRTKLAENYVHQIVEQSPQMLFPITTARTLHHTISNDYMFRQYSSIYTEQANVLHEMAEKSSCVIVGRCADYVLRERKGVLSVFVTADLDERIERIATERGISLREAESLIAQSEKRRSAYYNHYTFKKWGAAESYDLCLNASKLSIEACADIVMAAIEKMQ